MRCCRRRRATQRHSPRSKARRSVRRCVQPRQGGLNVPLQELLQRKGEVEIGAVRLLGQGRTPITLAAAGGHATTLQMLIDAGAEVNPRLDNWTPLMYAVDGGHLSAAKVRCLRSALHFQAPPLVLSF